MRKVTTLSKASKDRVLPTINLRSMILETVVVALIKEEKEYKLGGGGLKVNIVCFDLKVSFRHQMEMINELSYHSILQERIV